MKIAFAASEAAPFAKTGGLGDVLHALPSALASAGHDVTVFLPLYNSIKDSEYYEKMTFEGDFETVLGWRHQYTGVYSLKEGKTKPRFVFIDNEYYFSRSTLYGEFDDGERFAFFSRAVIEALIHLGFTPDIIHCNDWQTGLIPVFLREFYPEFDGIRTVYTIHNIEYQGQMPLSFADDVCGFDEKVVPCLIFGDCVNLMKAAIERSDAVGTVSKTYADEILMDYYGHGLSGILYENRHKLFGIVNGIDVNIYNPKKDRHLFMNYSAEDMSGKERDKLFLQEKLSLRADPKAPLVGIVSRLVSHKGLDLVERVLSELVSAGIQFAVLGTGDEHFEEFFRRAQNRHPGMVSASITFSNELASQIYAGCDMFLMPSKSEPCGLSQMIAMRYGAVPIVRETGGLKDTVPAYKIIGKTGRGFTFCDYNAHEMMGAIKRCSAFYRCQPDDFAELQKNNMQEDFSWKTSTKEYLELYKKLKA